MQSRSAEYFSQFKRSAKVRDHSGKKGCYYESEGAPCFAAFAKRGNTHTTGAPYLACTLRQCGEPLNESAGCVRLVKVNRFVIPSEARNLLFRQSRPSAEANSPSLPSY